MSDLQKAISYDNLKVILPYDIKILTELKIEKKLNDHSLVYITGRRQGSKNLVLRTCNQYKYKAG